MIARVKRDRNCVCYSYFDSYFRMLQMFKGVNSTVFIEDLRNGAGEGNRTLVIITKGVIAKTLWNSR